MSAPLSPEAAEAGRMVGQAIRERNAWRRWMNEVRAWLDLPHLVTDMVSPEDGQTTAEHMRMVVRDAARLPAERERVRFLEGQVQRLQEELETEANKTWALRKNVQRLESLVLDLGGDP